MLKRSPNAKTSTSLVAALSVAALLLSACSSDEPADDQPAAAEPDADDAPADEEPADEPADEPESGSEQEVQETHGDLCTYETYNGGVPQLDLSEVTIGFAQSEPEANPFRIAETESMKDVAAERGYDLITTNAEGDLNKEISDMQSMIDQGAQVLVISPLASEGLDPALEYAQEKQVPIMTIDRLLTTKEACVDYIGWVGSDFVEQGRRAADAMLKATDGEANLAILLGAAGVNVTTDRNAGFHEVIDGVEGINIVAEQAADYDRAKGQTVTEQLIQSNPEIDAIYAHNDEMALGAVAALQAAGYQPGEVKIITIDGTQGAVQGLIDGWISGVIESNPRFGPLAFDSLEAFYNGEGVPAVQIISDKEYTPENAESELPNAY